jgi:hypothetical protein
VWHIGITGKARAAAPHSGELFRINARGKGGQTAAPSSQLSAAREKQNITTKDTKATEGQEEKQKFRDI